MINSCASSPDGSVVAGVALHVTSVMRYRRPARGHRRSRIRAGDEAAKPECGRNQKRTNGGGGRGEGESIAPLSGPADTGAADSFGKRHFALGGPPDRLVD